MASGGAAPIGEIAPEFEAAVPVGAFLDGRTRLDRRECLHLVEQAIVVLEGLYVHLPQKRALCAVDPVPRLRRLQRDVSHDAGGAAFDDLGFHRTMVDAFSTLRDLHTMYILPEPFDRAVAFLPLRIEACEGGGERHADARRYIVTTLDRGLPGLRPEPGFTRGVEVTHWDDLPIAEAVERLGARNSGSNPDARMARGVARLTARPLARALPPPDEGVTLRYVAADGTVRSQRARWRVATFASAAALPSDADLGRALAEALDHETHLIANCSRLLSRRTGARRGRGGADAKPPVTRGRPVEVGAPLAGSMQAQRIAVGGRAYGYIRIFDFKIPDEASLEAFAAVLDAMPDAGLILDIRGNPGGCLQRAEELLQTLTPLRVEPATTQIINTPAGVAACRSLPRFRAWAATLAPPGAAGAGFSAGLPLSDAMACNRMGQRYYGPVVLITDALSYSSADIFAAGFQDHGIGEVIGLHTTTGGGGAEVVTHSFLCDRSRAGPGWPLRRLRRGDLRVAIRRTLRVWDRAGNVLEDLGVVSAAVHATTADDLLHGNVDLLRRAADHLHARPSYDLREDLGTLRRYPGHLTLRVRTRGLDRLEIALDGGFGSPAVAVGDGATTVQALLPPDGIATHLTLRGLRDGTLVAARRIRLPPPAA